MARAQSKAANPFFDGTFGGLADFGKLADQFRIPGVESFRIPGVDSKVLIDAQRKNVEAVTRANQVALEGAKAIMQRQVEILRQAMDESSKAVRELTKPGEPTEKWATQAELVKEAYELGLANLRELAEMGTKSNTEAADVLSHRFADGLEELKGVWKPAEAVK